MKVVYWTIKLYNPLIDDHVAALIKLNFVFYRNKNIIGIHKNLSSVSLKYMYLCYYRKGDMGDHCCRWKVGKMDI